jgi:hypothetical protein
VTTLNTVTGITTSAWVKVGIRCIGPNCEIFVNDRLIISRTDMTYTHRRIQYWVYDGTPGNGIADIQYYAVRPL